MAIVMLDCWGDRYQGDAKSVWTAAKLPEAIPWLRERM